ncbi:ABC transporter ATP-binding protein/permease [Caldibacillus lycopersici]|uniref:ABC transporter ATP-binding protein/permease n=1 Tax=Perspicuibacillus lycopersici TaxID=1325689 RepID=A0AAE3LTL0_9BACI|nr:ABC transporter ATP-binding protein [Perspicuibacillus lycopersici]MCU9614158.1 ABC transporter ATP-binding protein/permease [Perspicuibacillus lycopersici]
MKKILPFLKPFRIAIAISLVLTLLQTISEVYLPRLMSNIIDHGVVNGDIDYIWSIGGVMLLVAAGGMICSIFASFFSAKIATGFGRGLRDKVFKHVVSFSQDEFDKLGTASLITRTTNDINQVQQVLILTLRVMVMAPIMAIGGIFMALTTDAKLSLVFLISVPILALTIFLIARKGIPLFKVIQKKLDNLNRVLREKLIGVRVIRSFNRVKYEENRFNDANLDLTSTAIKVNKIMAFMMPLMMLIINFSTIAIVWFGSIRISNGDMQVGDLMAFIQYAMQIMFAFMMASMMFVLFPRAQVSATRINEILDTTSSIKNSNNPKSTSSIKGSIEFQNVTFHYPGAEIPAIANISFRANPGEVTAIIGGTGAGKSTLVNLIPRFYDVTEGTVLVDGIDVRKWNLDYLREKIGFVPQKAVLFTGTITENIKYGKQDASDTEVERALEIAQASSFIREMKDGLQTQISQGGTNVSGGQKQRLSIARALIKKPEIYIFDDSFSALDFKTDAKLRAALKNEINNATVLMIAQRVSTVMDADQIIVLDEGKIAGIGTHQELLQSSSVYHEIVYSQLSEEELA